jgi:hypothetical protein
MNKLLHFHNRENRSPFWELISCCPTLKSSKASPLHKGYKGNLCESSLPRSKEIRPHMKVVCPFNPTEMIDVAWSPHKQHRNCFKEGVHRRSHINVVSQWIMTRDLGTGMRQAAKSCVRIHRRPSVSPRYYKSLTMTPLQNWHQYWISRGKNNLGRDNISIKSYNGLWLLTVILARAK